MMTKNLTILGSTGSIGRQTLEVVEQLPVRIAALTAGQNVERMAEQCRRFRPQLAVMGTEEAAQRLREALAGEKIEIRSGMDGLIAAAEHPLADTVVTAVVGMLGLRPTLAAIRAKKRIALANKETLVCAGELVMRRGCGGRGGDKGEELGDNTIRPLELTEEEAALLKLVGGSDAEYGLFECAAGEGVSDCTVEVLSWEDGAWQTVAEGGVSISAAGTRRLGVVLSGDKITVNVQDGGTQYSYAPRLDGMDRGLETGRASVWLEEDQAMTIGERTPLYLEIYDDGEGVGIPPLPGGFSDLANLNQYDRAYAVAVTLKG